MFSKPIKYVRLKSLEEVKAFSYKKNKTGRPCNRKTFDTRNGNIVFIDEFESLYVTPYRSEIIGILERAGYYQRDLDVEFSYDEKRTARYQWLERIAEEERWARTFEEAYRVSRRKGIKPVDTRGINLEKICDITLESFDDKEKKQIFSRMSEQFKNENVGTYIIIDKNKLMVCDEYGRTYLLTIKGPINDMVNRLIKSGYKRTAHPEWYIKEYIQR